MSILDIPNIHFERDVNKELYSENEINWATVSKFPNERFFLITKDIFDLENYLSIHIKNHRQTIDGTGASFRLAVFRDSLHHTRRYEYPYTMLNIPQDTRSVLDVGGGSSFSYYVSEQVEEVYVLDIDQKIGDELKQIKEHTRRFKNMQFQLGDARNLPFADNLFDVTTCVSVLEHMDDKNLILALSEMMRVTKPNGVVIVTMDIQLDGSEGINLEDLYRIGKVLQIPVANPSFNTLYSSIDNHLYGVACMKLVGFKGEPDEL